MTVNQYNTAAELPVMNTYVPINFGELYRIGSAQRDVVEQAARDFGGQLQKFGEFRSPSAVDTENWYKLTTNREDVQDVVNKMASNPDFIKDAANRSYLLSVINSVDYGALSQLKESADNQRAGLEMRAKMAAEGRYKDTWDKANIPQYDTLGTGKVFDLITPLRYMTADELANPYFSNLKPSDIGSVWKDGVKYNRQGITYDTLTEIANARFNDLVNTPQGKEYYREALEATGGDPEAARQAFVGMIADSQRDRIINQDSVDPYWLAMAKRSGSGSTEIIRPNPTRLDFLNETINRSVQSKIGSRFNNYRDYIAGLVNKYPNSEISENAKKGIKNIDKMTEEYTQLNDLAMRYTEAYRSTGDDRYYTAAYAASNRADQLQSQMIGLANKHILRGEFEKTAGFSPIAVNSNKEFSKEGYKKGVKSALDLIKGKISIVLDDDLITALGALPQEIQEESGTKKYGYSFNNSEGFLLPETVFQLATETSPRTMKRIAAMDRDNSFPIKEAIESGLLKDVQFIPDGEILKPSPRTFALSGKLRIPKEDLNNLLGTGILGSNTLVNNYISATVAPLGRLSVKSALKDLLDGEVVKEVINEDGKEFYQIDIYRALPSYDVSPEYWLRINLKLQGGSSTGIGGASQAKDEYPTSAQQLLGGR